MLESIDPNYSRIARKFGVPLSTLRNRVNSTKSKGTVIVKGKPFTENEEQLLVEYIKKHQQGTPLTKKGFIEKVNSYLNVKLNLSFTS